MYEWFMFIGAIALFLFSVVLAKARYDQGKKVGIWLVVAAVVNLFFNIPIWLMIALST